MGRPRGRWEPVPGRWACEYSWGAGSSCGPRGRGGGRADGVKTGKPPLCIRAELWGRCG